MTLSKRELCLAVSSVRLPFLLGLLLLSIPRFFSWTGKSSLHCVSDNCVKRLCVQVFGCLRQAPHWHTGVSTEGGGRWTKEPVDLRATLRHKPVLRLTLECCCGRYMCSSLCYSATTCLCATSDRTCVVDSCLTVAVNRNSYCCCLSSDSNIISSIVCSCSRAASTVRWSAYLSAATANYHFVNTVSGSYSSGVDGCQCHAKWAFYIYTACEVATTVSSNNSVIIDSHQR